MRLVLAGGLVTTGLIGAAAAEAALRVASFHPLITDLAQQVGGSRLKVEGLVGPADDPHSFQPTAGDLKRMHGAHLILVSGKGMESYLPKLRSNLGKGQEILEVGRKVPSIKIAAGSLFVCCPTHSRGSIDPHWWHDPDNMKRAAGILRDAFTKADPAGAAHYKAHARAAGQRCDALKGWAKRQLSVIPRGDRKLVTAHAAFGYFCKEFGFRAVPVRGLTREREPSSKYLAETIAIMQKERVRAVFPEAAANPKVLNEMVRATGAKLGGRLIADGTGNRAVTTYDAMMRHNVATIVAALRPGA